MCLSIKSMMIPGYCFVAYKVLRGDWLSEFSVYRYHEGCNIVPEHGSQMLDGISFGGIDSKGFHVFVMRVSGDY